jgi:hypothetical protein
MCFDELDLRDLKLLGGSADEELCGEVEEWRRADLRGDAGETRRGKIRGVRWGCYFI